MLFASVVCKNEPEVCLSNEICEDNIFAFSLHAVANDVDDAVSREDYLKPDWTWRKCGWMGQMF